MAVLWGVRGVVYIFNIEVERRAAETAAGALIMDSRNVVCCCVTVTGTCIDGQMCIVRVFTQYPYPSQHLFINGSTIMATDHLL